MENFSFFHPGIRNFLFPTQRNWNFVCLIGIQNFKIQMSNKEFFSKIVTGIRNFFNFTQRNSEFLSSKILPHPPILLGINVSAILDIRYK